MSAAELLVSPYFAIALANFGVGRTRERAVGDQDVKDLIGLCRCYSISKSAVVRIVEVLEKFEV
jgi:hypothetical protein